MPIPSICWLAALVALLALEEGMSQGEAASPRTVVYNAPIATPMRALPP